MKRIHLISLILLSIGLVMSLPTQAEQERDFKPPQLGSPKIRTGAGTRAVDTEDDYQESMKVPMPAPIAKPLVRPEATIMPVKPEKNSKDAIKK